MSDRHVLALAGVVVLAAVVARRVAPVPLVVVVAAILWLAQRPIAFVVAVGLLASTLAAHAHAGLVAPAPQTIDGQWATLLTDPAPTPFGATGVELRLGRRHVQAYARGSAEGSLRARLAGERMRVHGELTPLRGTAKARAMPRHIAASLTISAISETAPANPLGASANAYRRVVARGATVLPESLQPLFGGMVLGDDRGQSEELRDAFRAAGLTHLMVVSGQNVAFALLVATPLLRRGRLWWRFAVTLLVLVAFGTMTRWEPSVLRATAMAAVAASGALLGRPVPAVRLLALAATACVLADPLLVHSVGFRLSLAACAGLALLSPWLAARRVPAVLAASIAAQAGAALVLIPTFGTIPLVSLPANVLAVPLAGPLMMWGLTAGPVAGLIPALAPILHVPTRLVLAWIAAVARWAASAPIAPIGWRGALVLAGAAVFVMFAHRHGAATSQKIGGHLTAGLLVLVVIGAALRPAAPARAVTIEPGVQLWVLDGRAVLAISGRASARVFDGLRNRRVHRVDVLVATKPGSAAADAVALLRTSFDPRVILAPEGHQIGGAYTARSGATATTGGVVVTVIDAGPPLRFRVGRAVYGRARDLAPHDAANRRPRLRHHPSQPRDGHPQPHARLVL